MFRLGWFVNYGFGQYGWNGRWSGNVAQDVANPDLFMAGAEALENGGFDYMMLEDASVLPDIYQGSFAHSVKRGTIRQDPMPLVPLLARATKHIGIVATMATTFYPPFMAARLINTLDHLTEGRFGANLVTASPHAAAQNFGYEKHFEHDLRYRMAGEWIQAVRALWNTWDEDAVIYDEERGMFADPDKVHYANFEGEFYKTRGPLNAVPSPQYHPVICQAGGSGPGREFAAANADTIIAAAPGIDGMRDYRDDITRLAVKNGRQGSDVKLLHLIEPVLADTVDEAKEHKRAKDAAAAADLDGKLAGLSYTSGIDMSQFDLDEPLPELEDKVNGHQSSYAVVAKMARTGKTFREILEARTGQQTVELVGTPESVADRMVEVMDEVGGDGYLVVLPFTRRNIADVTDGLAPALRRRGAIRDGYAHKTFKENLQSF
ncbi:MAG: FMNH2-dependent monooxygenase [Frondihabitans sp.]|nr:FMNH2-dependent monooxygenase [Frondihabitans sp.]